MRQPSRKFRGRLWLVGGVVASESLPFVIELFNVCIYPMRERSIQRKISDSHPRIVRLGGLARFLRCSERTIRNYCERGLIPEAIRSGKPGSHWHVRLPLSTKTRLVLWILKNPPLR